MNYHHEVVYWGRQKDVADEDDGAKECNYEYPLKPLRPMYPHLGIGITVQF